jgi:dephospho-CoA kinase
MQNNKIILGFVGDLASGKGTAAKYLSEKYSATTYRFSTMLRDILKRVYVPETRENLQQLSTFLRESYGQDVMSRVIAEDVARDENKLVIVEGIRRPSDIEYLKKLEGFHLIYITGDEKIRWQRLVARKENPGDSEKTFEEFLKDENAEADRMIKELGATAEKKIENDKGYEEFYRALEEVVSAYEN